MYPRQTQIHMINILTSNILTYANMNEGIAKNILGVLNDYHDFYTTDVEAICNYFNSTAQVRSLTYCNKILNFLTNATSQIMDMEITDVFNQLEDQYNQLVK